MSTKHYQHMEPAIREYFKRRGMAVAIEQHGSQGADLEGLHDTNMVGEIKHSGELKRDLPNKFWKDWNSHQRFGGKIPDYKLASEFDRAVAEMPGQVRGWLAVIYGQLRYYARKHGITSGWLVFEEYEIFADSLKQALAYLQENEKIKSSTIEEFQGLGFVCIDF
jgi:hypothetical protein